MPRPIIDNDYFFNPMYLERSSKKDKKVTGTSRSYYSDNEKPKWNELLNSVIKGYARVKTRRYDAFGENGKKTSTETIYYDAKGKKLASVFNVRSKSTNHNAIKTSTAEYTDWDMDGTIDSKDNVISE